MKELKIEIHIRSYAYEELSEEERRLVDAAKEATARSYAPYSRFHVGAAALLANGIIVSGSNQENAAYPSGTCAERTTLQPDSPLRRMPPSVVGDRATLWASHAHPPLQQSGNLLPKRSQKSPPPLLRRWVPEVICLHSASHLYACSYSTESSHNPNRQGLQSRYYKDCNPDLIKQQS